MKRRAFVPGLGAVVAAPLGAEAQAEKVFLVGFLTAYSKKADGPLREVGYEEGRNIRYQTRWAEGRRERLSQDRQGARPHHPTVAADASGPGD